MAKSLDKSTDFKLQKTSTSFKERLLEFIETTSRELKSGKTKPLGRSKFENLVGLPNGTISKDRDGMDSTTILKIKEKFPDLNLNWLIANEGDMLISDPKPPSEGAQVQLKRVLNIMKTNVIEMDLILNSQNDAKLPLDTASNRDALLDKYMGEEKESDAKTWTKPENDKSGTGTDPAGTGT